MIHTTFRRRVLPEQAEVRYLLDRFDIPITALAFLSFSFFLFLPCIDPKQARLVSLNAFHPISLPAQSSTASQIPATGPCASLSSSERELLALSVLWALYVLDSWFILNLPLPLFSKWNKMIELLARFGYREKATVSNATINSESLSMICQGLLQPIPRYERIVIQVPYHRLLSSNA